MAEDELLKRVVNLRELYVERRNKASKERQEAYDKGQWNHHTGMSYREADYIGIVQELNNVLRGFAEEKK